MTRHPFKIRWLSERIVSIEDVTSHTRILVNPTEFSTLQLALEEFKNKTPDRFQDKDSKNEHAPSGPVFDYD